MKNIIIVELIINLIHLYCNKSRKKPYYMIKIYPFLHYYLLKPYSIVKNELFYKFSS